MKLAEMGTIACHHHGPGLYLSNRYACLASGLRSTSDDTNRIKQSPWHLGVHRFVLLRVGDGSLIVLTARVRIWDRVKTE